VRTIFCVRRWLLVETRGVATGCSSRVARRLLLMCNRWIHLDRSISNILPFIWRVGARHTRLQDHYLFNHSVEGVVWLQWYVEVLKFILNFDKSIVDCVINSGWFDELATNIYVKGLCKKFIFDGIEVILIIGRDWPIICLCIDCLCSVILI
jgi:hypothetical protein